MMHCTIGLHLTRNQQVLRHTRKYRHIIVWLKGSVVKFRTKVGGKFMTPSSATRLLVKKLQL